MTTFVEMFENCGKLLNLDLSSFTADSLDYGGRGIYSMFNGCVKVVTINLSNFIIYTDYESSTFSTNRVFRACSALQTIVSEDWTAVSSTGEYSTDVFTGCTSLVGEAGTVFNSSMTTSQYAHIDTTDNPGYFTTP